MRSLKVISGINVSRLQSPAGPPGPFRGIRVWRAVLGAAICIAGALLPVQACPQDRGQPRLPFEGRLGIRLNGYEVAGKPFLQAFLDLVYEYRLPAGLEYLDRDAVSKPLSVRLQNATVRDALSAIVAQLPEYRVTFSSGLVQVYSLRARAEPSSMFNVVIPNFSVNNVDPVQASFDVFGALSATLHPDWGYGGDFAPLGGPKKITLHLQRAKVYEALDAIVAQQGETIWVVRVPPERLSTFQGDLWHLYSLDPIWKHVALEDGQSLFPAQKPTPR